MRKFLTLIAVLLASIGVINAQTTVTWSLTDSSNQLGGVSSETSVTVKDATYGSGLTLGTVKTYNEGKGTLFSPKDATERKSPYSGQNVDFSFVVPSGYAFTPKSVSFFSAADGSGNAHLLDVTVKGNAASSKIVDKYQLGRGSSNAESKTVTVSGVEALEGEVTIVFDLYGKTGGTAKGWTIGDLVISGDLVNLSDSRTNAPISWNPESVTLKVRDAFTAPVFVNAENLPVSFVSSNEDLATVTADGVISLVDGVTGTAIVTATYDGDADGALYKTTAVTTTITVNTNVVDTYAWETYDAPESLVPDAMWTADKTSGTLEANTDLINDDNLKASTVYAAKYSNYGASYLGNTFAGSIQLGRVAADPSQDVLSGTEQADNSPIIVTPATDLKLVVFGRRQGVEQRVEENDNTADNIITRTHYIGFSANDNKGLYANAHSDIATKLPQEVVLGKFIDEAKGNDYLHVANIWELKAGESYTVWTRGTTFALTGIGYILPETEDPEEPGDDDALTVTAVAAEMGFTTSDDLTVMSPISLNDDVQISFAGGNANAKYASAGYVNVAPNSTITVKGATEDVKIEEIIFEVYRKSYRLTDPDITPADGELSYDEDALQNIWKAGTPANEVVFKLYFDNLRFNSITVKYTKADSDTPVDPDPVDPEVPQLASHYDFTAWSEATVANLKADTAAWSDIEKATDSEPTEASKDNCYWMVGTNVAIGANGNLYADGKLIEELKGLDFTTAPATRNLALAVNYPEAVLSGETQTYHGGAYLWLGGSKKDYFVMHGVKPGNFIKMGVESHKTSEARGVELYVYADGAKGDKLVGPDGNAVAAPKEYTEQTWAVPAGEAPVDIMVYNTNGCHIYFIDITEEAETPVEPTEKAPISWSAESVTITVGDEFTAPVIVNEENLALTYASDNTDLAAVSEEGVITLVEGATGTATVSATYAGEAYLETTVSTVITVNAKPEEPKGNPFAPKGDEEVVGEIQFLHNPGGTKAPTLSGAELGAPEGWSIECTVSGKNVESSSSITIDDTKYTTMKLNNGGLHIVTLPEGYVANAVWIYSVNNTEGATDRPCYWAEVDGVTYDKPDYDYLDSYKDFANPAISYFKLSGGNSFTLKNSGEQQLIVLKVDYTAAGEEPDPDDPVDPQPGEHTYDFSAWSAETVANLMADTTAWSDIEKADATEPTEASKDNCFWMIGSNVAVGAEGNLYADGKVIEELKGLDFSTAPTTRNLAIAVNYPEAVISGNTQTYKGGAYLWLGGSGKDYFVMHNVEPGTTIKMGVESHNNTNARGVELYTYVNGEKVTKLLGADGSEVTPPTLYAEQEWAVPGVVGDAPVDIMVYNTNGCHLYFIDVVTAEGPETGIADVITDADSDAIYFNLQGVRVQNPAAGAIYIRVQGNKVDKVVIR